MLNALDAKLAQAVPALPVVQAVLRVAVRGDVRGVDPRGSLFSFQENTEDWWLAQGR